VDIFSIGLRVDSRQINKGKEALNRFGQQSKKTGSDVGKFNAKTKAAAASTKAMGSASKFATRAVAGIGAALSIRALTRYTTSAISAADSIGKMAQTAGVTAERLQELRFAFGQLAGTTDSEVDASLRRFNRRLGLAADGTGAAKDTFGELGIAIADAGGNLRNTEAVLEDTLFELSQIDDASRRAAKASEIFGEDAGPALAGALSEGQEAVRRLSQEARDLGIILGDDAVKSAEALADQMDILNKTMMVNFQEGLMSSLAGDADSFSEAIADQQFQDGLKTLGEFIGESLSFLVENADTIIRVGRALALVGLSAKLGGAIGGRKGAMVGIGAGGFLAGLAELVANNEAAEQGEGGGQAPSPDAQVPQRISGPEKLAHVNTLGIRVDLLEMVQSATVEATDKTSALDRAMQDVGESLQDIAKTMTDDVSDGLTDIIMQAESASDVFAGLARQIARTLVQQQIADPLAQSITGFASNMAGSIFGTGTTATPHGVGPGGMKTNANGGNVFGGVPSIVGERGPEVFVPGQDGQIVPNHQMGGGGNVTVNVINQGGEQLEAQQQQTRRGPNGEMTVDVMVKSSMERLDSQGQLDGIFRRHGAQRQGQF